MFLFYHAFSTLRQMKLPVIVLPQGSHTQLHVIAAAQSSLKSHWTGERAFKEDGDGHD